MVFVLPILINAGEREKFSHTIFNQKFQNVSSLGNNGNAKWTLLGYFYWSIGTCDSVKESKVIERSAPV